MSSTWNWILMFGVVCGGFYCLWWKLTRVLSSPEFMKVLKVVAIGSLAIGTLISPFVCSGA